MVTIVKVSDFKIGDVIKISRGLCTIVAFSDHRAFDIVVRLSSEYSEYRGYLLIGEGVDNNYKIPIEQFINIDNKECSNFYGITIGNIRSTKVMRSKLADRIYKNFQKHGETEEYFYVNKDI